MERLGLNTCDNEIQYDVGPFKLQICGFSKTITITYADSK
jgi:hypothetical protein